MGGGRKRACLLLLPEVPQGGQNFYKIELIFVKNKNICTDNSTRYNFEFHLQIFGYFRDFHGFRSPHYTSFFAFSHMYKSVCIVP